MDVTIELVPDEEAFIGKLKNTVSPALPIRTIELLRGRESELETIRRALVMPGRHAFIFGDRGVGKSSLAHTAANLCQSSDGAPITVSGSADGTFNSIVANIAYQALDRSRVEEVSKRTQGVSFSWRGLSLGGNREVSPVDFAAHLRTIGDAAGLLAEIGALHSQAPIIVLDEFDTIADVNERNKFASLIKILGDQEVSVTFIFTGIGASLDGLLGAHQSSYRQLATVELGRLGWDGRREIAMSAAHSFGLDLDNNIAWRIAMVSDGFPYYVHLIMEKMLWEAFTADERVDLLDEDHYLAGLSAAIGDITAELRRPYEKAVLNRDAEYEDVVWATADGEDLQRDSVRMYDSYKMVCMKRQKEAVLSRQKFGERLRQLRSASYGRVLRSIEKRAGWFTYNEKMLRGYVRMQAEANGVELSGAALAPRQRVHVPTNARSGYKGSTIPRGVKLNAEGQAEDSDEPIKPVLLQGPLQ